MVQVGFIDFGHDGPGASRPDRAVSAGAPRRAFARHSRAGYHSRCASRRRVTRVRPPGSRRIVELPAN